MEELEEGGGGAGGRGGSGAYEAGQSQLLGRYAGLQEVLSVNHTTKGLHFCALCSLSQVLGKVVTYYLTN